VSTAAAPRNDIGADAVLIMSCQDQTAPSPWIAADLRHNGNHSQPFLHGATWDGNGNWEWQVYSEQNVLFDDGDSVTLFARRRPPSDPLIRLAYQTLDIEEVHTSARLQYDSAKIVSTQSFGRGTLEFTVTNPRRMPLGAWPSVWLVGERDGRPGADWPDLGEIDVMEKMPIPCDGAGGPLRCLHVLSTADHALQAVFHFGRHRQWRNFSRGRVRTARFGPRLAYRVTRSCEAVRVDVSDADSAATSPESRWETVHELRLDSALLRAVFGHPMRLVANVAVGAFFVPDGSRDHPFAPLVPMRQLFSAMWRDKHARMTIGGVHFRPQVEPCLAENASCTAHPDCAALRGKCCPTDGGDTLECCSYRALSE